MTRKTQQSASLDRFLPLAEVKATTSLSKTAIYRKLGENPPSFPAPLRISKARVAWRQADIARWMSEQPPIR